jgi:cation diffusion facilitator family transporter
MRSLGVYRFEILSSNHDHDHPAPGFLGRVKHRLAHSHDHGEAGIADTGAAGVRAAKVSLLGLGITAVLQAVLVAFTGSVALLSDTLHNLTDALTAIPLWIAFALGRRDRTQKYTYGMNRAEDLAGLLIVLAIAASAIGVTWESIRRLISPRELEYAVWVIVAGIAGAAGNELVALQDRGGTAHLLAPDRRRAARPADALTSLAVVAAGAGSLLGADWVDPVAGLVVAVMILTMLRRSAARVFGRLLDAVDPELVDRATATARAVEGVVDVDDVRMRWHGHRMLVTMLIAVDPEATVRTGHHIAQHVSHDLIHAFDFAVDALVHVDPSGDHSAHLITAHHHR